MASILQVEQIQGPTSGANANTIQIPSGQTLDLTNATRNLGLSTDDMPAGSVVQVITSFSNTQVVNNTTSMVNAGLSVSITPKYSTSKIIVDGHLGLNVANTNNQGIGARMTLNGTWLESGGDWTGLSNNSNNFILFYHDSGHSRDFYGQMPFMLTSTAQLTAGQAYNFIVKFRGWINESNTIINPGYASSTIRATEIKQ